MPRIEKTLNICVTGGAGYVGSLLVPHLVALCHRVTVIDTFWFGDHLEDHKHLRKIKGDIRLEADLRKAFAGQDVIIHLACISNDPSFELDPRIGKSINFDSFVPMLRVAKEQGVKRFIYASSSSVYGVKSIPNVTEDVFCEPLTDYSKYKLKCENILRNERSLNWTILRPATVCGYSPRLRLDVVVNLFTAQAIQNKRLTVFGGGQLRPNINIKDMVHAYVTVLENPEKARHKIFNVGFENKTLRQIAEKVSDLIPSELVYSESNDNRSYHVDSSKFQFEFKFSPKYTITDAVESIKLAHASGALNDMATNRRYYNIQTMKELK